MVRRIKSKKAQIRDIAFVLITLTSIAITMVIAGYLYNKIGDGFDDSGLHSNESEIAYGQFGNAFPIFDSSFIFIMIGLTIGLIISAFAIPSHPIFIVINIIGFLVLTFLGAIFSNLYGDVIAQEGLSNASGMFPVVTYAMSMFPYFAAGIVLLITIIMYSKSKQG